MFAVQVARSGPAEWCTRKGCRGCRWEALDAIGPQRYAQIEVEDAGRGITAEEMDRLFEPFFTTKGARGTGLGLAVTWGIVEGHDGSIAVESEPGRGTRFTLRIPFRVLDPAGAGEGAGRPVPMPDARGVAASGQAAPIASRAQARAAEGSEDGPRGVS